MVIQKDRPVQRILMRVTGIVAIVVGMAIWYLNSCQNKFIRDWEEKTLTIGNANLRTNLSTYRFHDPSGQGRFGHYDEFRYDLSVEEQAVEKDKPADFLERSSNIHPEIFFVNRDGEPVVEPIKVDLKEDANLKGTWKATGSLVYSSEMKKARDWFLQFEPAGPPREEAR